MVNIVTIKDVAKEAGVSLSTTSFALNDVQGRVSEKVKARVLLAAQKLGYVPNASARSLRAKAANTIGLIYDESFLEERNASTMLFVSSVIKYANKKNKDVLIKLVSENVNWEADGRKYLDLWWSKKIDGLIFYCDLQDIAFKNEMKSKKVPYISIPQLERCQEENTIYLNNYQMMYQGLEYIKEKGYNQIYHLTMKAKKTNERERAFINFIEATGINGKSLYYQNSYRSKEDIWNAISEVVLARTQRIAITCWNDVDAMNVVDVLRGKGIKIPQEVGVLGFDDLPGAEHTDPPLTTIRQPFEEMARMSIKTLLEATGEDFEKGIPAIEISGVIIERESI